MAQGSEGDDRFEVELGFKNEIGAFTARVSTPNPFETSERNAWQEAKSIRRIAKRDALNGTPTPEQNEPAAIEDRIDLARGTGVAVIKDWLIGCINSTRNHLVDCTPAVLNKEVVRSQVENRVKAKFDAWRTRLEDQRKQHGDAESQLQRFRQANESVLKDRPAKFPDTVMQPLSLLALAFLVEGLINATLFAGVSSQGFVGAMVLAFGLSFVNVLLGLVTGHFALRNAFHVVGARRWAGAIASGVLIVAGLMLNLFVAHYRDAAERSIQEIRSGNLDQAPVSIENINLAPVWDEFTSGILALDTIVAFILLAMGLAIFGFAVYEGFQGLDDPYPGYGERVRHHQKRKSAHDGLITSARASVLMVLDRARQALARDLKAHGVAHDSACKTRDWLRAKHDEATNLEEQVNKTARVAIAQYRQTNEAVRRTRNGRYKNWFIDFVCRRGERHDLTAAPAYFTTQITYRTELASIEPEMDQTRELLGRLDANVAVLQNAQDWLEKFALDVEARLRDLKRDAEPAQVR